MTNNPGARRAGRSALLMFCALGLFQGLWADERAEAPALAAPGSPPALAEAFERDARRDPVFSGSPPAPAEAPGRDARLGPASAGGQADRQDTRNGPVLAEVPGRDAAHVAAPDSGRPKSAGAATGEPAPEDAASVPGATAVPLAAMVPGLDIEEPPGGWPGDIDLLRRIRGSSWSGIDLLPALPPGATSHIRADTAALSADGGTLLLVTGKPRLSHHRKLIFHKRGRRGWEAEAAVALNPLPYDLDDLGGAPRLLLVEPDEEPFSINVRDVALSADGGTAAVALSGLKDSRSPDRVIAPSDPPGAVAVFARRDGEWTRETLLRAPEEEGAVGFGAAIVLSPDGQTLLVGSPAEAATANGGGMLFEAGAVHRFVREDGRWRPGGRLLAKTPRALERMGYSLSLSADGRTLAAGTDSAGAADMHRLVGRYKSPKRRMPDEPVPSGAVHIFRLEGGKWIHSAVVRPRRPEPDGAFGMAVALSASGESLAVGAPSKHENEETGAEPMGAAYLFRLKRGRWSQKSLTDAPGGGVRFFGLAVAIDDRTGKLLVQAVANGAFTTPAYSHPVKKLDDLATKAIPGLLFFAY